MQFGAPMLIFGFYLLMVPVIIHLINMMRHRRVKWAAMDFLLASYKKHRNYVWLKQLLLLLSRLSVIGLLVLLVANFHGCTNSMMASLGGQTVHHYVLLDDSYSMGDSSGGTRAFDRARQVISAIAQQANETGTPQRLTLIRYSKAGRAVQESEGDNLADLSSESTGVDFLNKIEQVRVGLEVSQLSIGNDETLQVVEQLIAATPQQQANVYLLSDFRAAQWENLEGVRQSLHQLQEHGANLHFIDCAVADRGNLAITHLAPDRGSLAAGVPTFVNITVKNYSEHPIRDVTVAIETTAHVDRATVALPPRPGQITQQPAVLFPEIGAGQSRSAQTRVYFPSAGQHVVRASLPHDSILSDNTRWAVLEMPANIPVLLIDGSEVAQHHAFFLRSLFGPIESDERGSEGRSKTGVQTTVERPSYLRDLQLDELNRYHMVYLLDVPTLDPKAMANLQAYVEGGGGLAIFMGDQCDWDFYNAWHAEGEGLFPVAFPQTLDRKQILPPRTSDQSVDIETVDHPLFKVFQLNRQLLRAVLLDTYVATDPNWEPEETAGVSVIARVRDRGDPLIIERRLGEGQMLVVLTTLAPDWNNWAGEFSFGIFHLELKQYLSTGRGQGPQRHVGTPIELQFNAQQYQPEVTFYLPQANTDEPIEFISQAIPSNGDASLHSFTLGATRAEQEGPHDVDIAGIYEAWISKTPEADTSDARYEVRRMALNVDPYEGDTTLPDRAILQEELSSLDIDFHQAESFRGTSDDQEGSWSGMLLLGLILLLLLEQVFAYLSSFHAARGEVA